MSLSTVPNPITEEMHVAACKVLTRASGLHGTPQRMLDAMLAAAPSVPSPQVAQAEPKSISIQEYTAKVEADPERAAVLARVRASRQTETAARDEMRADFERNISSHSSPLHLLSLERDPDTGRYLDHIVYGAWWGYCNASATMPPAQYPKAGDDATLAAWMRVAMESGDWLPDAAGLPRMSASKTKSAAQSERLRKFLDVAAGEGYVFDGVDAGELYLELFPTAFAAGLKVVLDPAMPAGEMTARVDGKVVGRVVGINATPAIPSPAAGHSSTAPRTPHSEPPTL